MKIGRFEESPETVVSNPVLDRQGALLELLWEASEGTGSFSTHDIVELVREHDGDVPNAFIVLDLARGLHDLDLIHFDEDAGLITIPEIAA